MNRFAILPALWLPALFQGPPRRPLLAISGVLLLAAFIAGLWFALRICRDCPRHSRMRLAWSLIAAACCTGAIQYAFEFIAMVTGGPGNPIVGFRQFPNILHLLCLFIGLLVMRSSFATLRLGKHLRWPDGIAMALIIALVPRVIALRGHLPDSGSVYASVRLLQSIGPVLIFSCALIGVLLYRVSRDMGDGRMAAFLRLLVIFLLMRPLALTLRLSPLIEPGSLPAVMLMNIARLSDLVFIAAIVRRWKVTQRATKLADTWSNGVSDRREADQPARDV